MYILESIIAWLCQPRNLSFTVEMLIWSCTYILKLFKPFNMNHMGVSI